jgi:pyruvate formate lyase activating enzyme
MLRGKEVSVHPIPPPAVEAGRCRLCGLESTLVATRLGACAACIKSDSRHALPLARTAHREARRLFDLPEDPARASRGVLCGACVHECRMAAPQRGYCNLRHASNSHMEVLAGNVDRGLLRSYRDPLPTNCVAMDVCAERATTTRSNLAVVYGSCTFDCLFCQNWEWREDARAHAPLVDADAFAHAVTGDVACISHFGGDPAQQAPFAIAASRRVATERPVRVCWETNGTAHPAYLKLMIDLSLETGGTIKFELKAWNDPLHEALTGFSNRRTIENFEIAARRFGERREPPLVVASTLLIPGYVDEDEVRALGHLIASIEPAIPYRLLGFVPAFLMANLPPTSRAHAARCVAAARDAGLLDVAVGNEHLLSDAY